MKKHTQRKTIAVAIINKVFKEMDTNGLEIKTIYNIGKADSYWVDVTKKDVCVRIKLEYQCYSWEVFDHNFDGWELREEKTENYPYYVADIVNHIVTYVIRRYLEP